MKSAPFTGRSFFGYNVRMMSPDELGRIAYAAYGATTDYKNYRGEPMPQWDDLPTVIRRAWGAAGTAIIMAVTGVGPMTPVKLVDPEDVKTCTHCGFIWPPGHAYGRCPGCQQIYDG